MNTISRRHFAFLLGTGAVAAAAQRGLALGATTAKAAPGSGIVRLSANENPYGPSPKAVKAMSEAFKLASRYPDEHSNNLIDSLATLNGVDRSQILLGDGSSEILKLCAETFTGPERGKLVVADPTFEAILNHAGSGGAEVSKVALTSSYSHDLSGMAAAARKGLIYICNPNNPTASITPKAELAQFLNGLPAETMILVDEAYYHYADSPDYESVIPLVKDHPNLIVARTFSKVYGMAGLRCGYCVASKQVIDQLHAQQPWDSVNIMALTAASASLADPDQVKNGHRLNSDVRAFVTNQLASMGYETIPSQANFIMVDVKRPVVPLTKALKEQKVEVGRLFPALPNHMRVTIGSKPEMQTFLAAFRQVVAA